MRILLVTEDIPVPFAGGAAKHAVLLGNTLIEAGHDVELLGRLRASAVTGNNDFIGTMHCRIDLRGTGWQEHRFGAFLPGRRDHIGRRVWSTVRALGIERFDVIHYHGHHSAVGASVPEGVNFVQTVHDQGSECITMTRFKHGALCSEVDPRACASCATSRPNALQTALSAAAVRRLRRASTIAFSRHKTIFVSEFLGRRFHEHVQPAMDLNSHVVHNFTQTTTMRQLATNGLPIISATERPVALVVGRLDRSKGISALLDCAPDALIERFRWRIVGDGPDRPTIEAKHRPRGVEFMGFLPQHQVYAETMAAAICIVPSVCEESCATTILEALAFGRPMFALNRGGTPELSRYARYSGQLMLSESMQGLIETLHAFPWETAPRFSDVDDSADVLHRIPALLNIYRLPVSDRSSTIESPIRKARSG